jgi:hypothetical protein
MKTVQNNNLRLVLRLIEQGARLRGGILADNASWGAAQIDGIDKASCRLDIQAHARFPRAGYGARE